MKTATSDFFSTRVFPSRFLILFLGTLVWFGSYYCLDIPSVIKGDLIEMLNKHRPGEAEYYFDLMYSLYSLPNVFLPILSGILIDKIGYNLPLVLFSGFACVGNLITYIGMRYGNVELLLAGRFFFGIGGESLGISINALLISWFKEKELAFSQALNLSFGRAASVLNCFLSPYAARYSLSLSYGLASWICLMSFFAAILVALVDSSLKSVNVQSAFSDVSTNMNSRKQSFKEIMKQLCSCKAIFWVHVVLICMFYLAYLPFNIVASGYISERWLNGVSMSSSEKAQRVGSLLSIPLLVSSTLFPLFGHLIDRYGRRLHFLTASAMLLVTCYIFFLNSYFILPLIILGLSYAIFGATLWPVLALLVPQRILGTALGLVTILQNLSMTLFPIFLAYLSSKYNSNVQGMMSLFVNAIASLVLVFVVYYLDTKNKVSLASNDQAAIVEAIEKEHAIDEGVNRDTTASSNEEESEKLL